MPIPINQFQNDDLDKTDIEQEKGAQGKGEIEQKGMQSGAQDLDADKQQTASATKLRKLGENVPKIQTAESITNAAGSVLDMNEYTKELTQQNDPSVLGRARSTDDCTCLCHPPEMMAELAEGECRCKANSMETLKFGAQKAQPAQIKTAQPDGVLSGADAQGRENAIILVSNPPDAHGGPIVFQPRPQSENKRDCQCYIRRMNEGQTMTEPGALTDEANKFTDGFVQQDTKAGQPKCVGECNCSCHKQCSAACGIHCAAKAKDEDGMLKTLYDSIPDDERTKNERIDLGDKKLDEKFGKKDKKADEKKDEKARISDTSGKVDGKGKKDEKPATSHASGKVGDKAKKDDIAGTSSHNFIKTDDMAKGGKEVKDSDKAKGGKDVKDSDKADDQSRSSDPNFLLPPKMDTNSIKQELDEILELSAAKISENENEKRSCVCATGHETATGNSNQPDGVKLTDEAGVQVAENEKRSCVCATGHETATRNSNQPEEVEPTNEAVQQPEEQAPQKPSEALTKNATKLAHMTQHYLDVHGLVEAGQVSVPVNVDFAIELVMLANRQADPIEPEQPNESRQESQQVSHQDGTNPDPLAFCKSLEAIGHPVSSERRTSVKPIHDSCLYVDDRQMLEFEPSDKIREYQDMSDVHRDQANLNLITTENETTIITDGTSNQYETLSLPISTRFKQAVFGFAPESELAALRESQRSSMQSEIESDDHEAKKKSAARISFLHQERNPVVFGMLPEEDFINDHASLAICKRSFIFGSSRKGSLNQGEANRVCACREKNQALEQAMDENSPASEGSEQERLTIYSEAPRFSDVSDILRDQENINSVTIENETTFHKNLSVVNFDQSVMNVAGGPQCASDDVGETQLSEQERICGCAERALDASEPYDERLTIYSEAPRFSDVSDILRDQENINSVTIENETTFHKNLSVVNFEQSKINMSRPDQLSETDPQSNLPLKATLKKALFGFPPAADLVEHQERLSEEKPITMSELNLKIFDSTAPEQVTVQLPVIKAKNISFAHDCSAGVLKYERRSSLVSNSDAPRYSDTSDILRDRENINSVTIENETTFHRNLSVINFEQSVMNVADGLQDASEDVGETQLSEQEKICKCAKRALEASEPTGERLTIHSDAPRFSDVSDILRDQENINSVTIENETTFHRNLSVINFEQSVINVAGWPQITSEDVVETKWSKQERDCGCAQRALDALEPHDEGFTNYFEQSVMNVACSPRRECCLKKNLEEYQEIDEAQDGNFSLHMMTKIKKAVFGFPPQADFYKHQEISNESSLEPIEEDMCLGDEMIENFPTGIFTLQNATSIAKSNMTRSTATEDLSQIGAIDDIPTNPRVCECRAKEGQRVQGFMNAPSDASVRKFIDQTLEEASYVQYTGTVKKPRSFVTFGGKSSQKFEEVPNENYLWNDNLKTESAFSFMIPVTKSLTTVSSMTEMVQPGRYTALGRLESRNEKDVTFEDDDGYNQIKNYPSQVNQVVSSAWIDENISFMVEPEESRHFEKASLSQGLRSIFQGNQPDDAKESVAESFDSETPSAKKKGKLRKCKCMLKRVSNMFRKNKD